MLIRPKFSLLAPLIPIPCYTQGRGEPLTQPAWREWAADGDHRYSDYPGPISRQNEVTFPHVYLDDDKERDRYKRRKQRKPLSYLDWEYDRREKDSRKKEEEILRMEEMKKKEDAARKAEEAKKMELHGR